MRDDPVQVSDEPEASALQLLPEVDPEPDPSVSKVAPHYTDSWVDKIPRAHDAFLGSPTELARGKSAKSFSLLRPQKLAQKLLPEDRFITLWRYCHEGVEVDCGPLWDPDSIEIALNTGPHVSALSPASTQLVWDDVTYQENAGFTHIFPESKLRQLFDINSCKISRVAVIPQKDRRDRIILNLSAPVRRVPTASRRRKRDILQMSVNATTVPAECQEAVKRLGTALPTLLWFMFEVPGQWIIYWFKIDLSDGFWRMVVAGGTEVNFIYQLPPRPDDIERFFALPGALQMGWMNSPPYFCDATEAIATLAYRLMAISPFIGGAPRHHLESHTVPVTLASDQDKTARKQILAEFLAILRVFVDDFMGGLAVPPEQESDSIRERFARAVLHSIHAVFPPPEVSGHKGGKDSVSVKKLIKGDGRFDTTKELLGFNFVGDPGAG